MADTYRVQVITEDYVEQLGGTYRDAQYFDVPSSMSIDTFKTLKASEITAEKNKRIAERITEKLNPPPVPNKAQLQAERAELAERVAELDVKIGQM